MAVININSSQDGCIVGPLSSTFNSAKSAETGALVVANPSTSNVSSVFFSKAPGRGRGSEYRFTRAAVGFDVSDYSSDTISSISLRITTRALEGVEGENVVYAVPFDGFGDELGSPLTTSNFSNFGFSSTYGNAEFAQEDSVQTINISLSSAVQAMFTSGYVKIGLVQGNDYNNNEPEAEEFSTNNAFDYSQASNIQIRFTQASAGYSQNVIGVSSSNMAKVIAVPKSSISKVIGIS